MQEHYKKGEKIMNRNSSKNIRFLSLLLLITLIAAMALSLVSCGTINNEDTSNQNVPPTDAITLGDGAKSFYFEVVFADNSVKSYIIKTNKEVVGDALTELGLISGEEGPYGLMVFTVDGETHDYDVDQTYWAFYVNGEYAISGIDTTDIVEGTKYSFKVGK